MICSKRLVPLALAITALTSPATAQIHQTASEIAGPADFDRGEITGAIAEILEKHRVAGAHVAVTFGPDTVLSRAFGSDPLTNEDFTSKTTVRLASASKMLTALTVASLVETGRLSLDETLGDVDADIPDAWKDVPVWRVLNHTSGLPMIVVREEFGAMDENSLSRFSIADLYSIIGQDKLDFEPGEQWRYQQSGFALLANALAKRSGTTWDELVAQTVTEPAELSSTKIGNDAAVFELRDDKLVRHFFDYPAFFAAAGGFQTNGEDTRRLLLALAKGELINEDTIRSLINDQTRVEQLRGDAEGEGYGSGVAVQRFGDIAFFGHSGGGGLVDIRYSPERQIGIAVLTNRAGGTGAAIEIADLLTERLVGEAHTG